MAVDLDVTTATTQIEVALRDTVALGLRRQYPALASVAALRAWSTLGESGTSNFDDVNVELVPAPATSAVYRGNATSLQADDGALAIAPADRVGVGIPGRWLKTSVAVGAGFLLAVRLYEG